MLIQYIVAADGSLEQSIVIPSSIPAGYHRIVVSGETYSGELIEFEQIILVESSDPGDRDENNVPDNKQLCGPFLAAANQDMDKDGIDDGCDPLIERVSKTVSSDVEQDNGNVYSEVKIDANEDLRNIQVERGGKNTGQGEYTGRAEDKSHDNHQDSRGSDIADQHIDNKVSYLVASGVIIVLVGLIAAIFITRKRSKERQ